MLRLSVSAESCKRLLAYVCLLTYRAFVNGKGLREVEWMAGKKRLLWTTVLVCVMLLLPYARAAKETAHYFYLNACETCHPEDTFANEFTHLTGKKTLRFRFFRL